jgi:hypothetical protein
MSLQESANERRTHLESFGDFTRRFARVTGLEDPPSQIHRDRFHDAIRGQPSFQLRSAQLTKDGRYLN